MRLALHAVRFFSFGGISPCSRWRLYYPRKRRHSRDSVRWRILGTIVRLEILIALATPAPARFFSRRSWCSVSISVLRLKKRTFASRGFICVSHSDNDYWQRKWRSYLSGARLMGLWRRSKVTAFVETSSPLYFFLAAGYASALFKNGAAALSNASSDAPPCVSNSAQGASARFYSCRIRQVSVQHFEVRHVLPSDETGRFFGVHDMTVMRAEEASSFVALTVLC